MLWDWEGGLSFVMEQLGPRHVSFGRSYRWKQSARPQRHGMWAQRDQIHIFIHNSAHLLQTRPNVWGAQRYQSCLYQNYVISISYVWPLKIFVAQIDSSWLLVSLLRNDVEQKRRRKPAAIFKELHKTNISFQKTQATPLTVCHIPSKHHIMTISLNKLSAERIFEVTTLKS